MSDSNLSQEYVRSSWRNGGYFRTRPYTRDTPTLAQRRARYELARIAHEDALDQVGTVEVEGKTIPLSAKIIKEKMKPVTVPKPMPIPTWVLTDRELLRRIILESIV